MFSKRGQVEVTSKSRFYLIGIIVAALFVVGLAIFLIYPSEDYDEDIILSDEDVLLPDSPVSEIDWTLLSNAPPVDEEIPVYGGGGSGGPGPDCRDYVCGSDDCQICPADCSNCGPVCGDGKCESPETVLSCSKDCVSCGNGVCGSDETDISCPEDCGFFKTFSHYSSKFVFGNKIIKRTNITSERSSYYTELLLRSDGISKARNLTFVFDYGGFPIKYTREIVFGYSGISRLNFGIANILMLRIIDGVSVFDESSGLRFASSSPKLLGVADLSWRCGDGVCNGEVVDVPLYENCPAGFRCEDLTKPAQESLTTCPKDCAQRALGLFNELNSSFLSGTNFTRGLRDYTNTFVFPDDFNVELQNKQISESVGKYKDDCEPGVICCDAQKKIALDYPVGRPIVRDHGRGYCYGSARNYYPHPVGEGMFDAWAYCKNNAQSGYCERLTELADFGVWQQYDSMGCSDFIAFYTPIADPEWTGSECNPLYAGGWPSLSFDWTDAFRYAGKKYEPSHHVDAMEALGLLYAYNQSGDVKYLDSVKLFLDKQRPRYAGGSGVYQDHEYTWDTYSPVDGADATDIMKNGSVDNVQTLISAVYAAAGYYDNNETYLDEAEKLLWYNCREFERDGRWFYHGDESWFDEAKAVSHDSAVLRDSLITLWFLNKANHADPELVSCYNRAYDFYLKTNVDTNNYFKTIVYDTMMKLAVGEPDSPFNKANLNALNFGTSSDENE